MNMMRDVIGLNKASDASTPDKESLVGIQKLASLNSNTATRHILDGACDITKRLALGIVYRIADLLKYSDLKEDFARKIGATAVMDLDEIKTLHLYDFAIYLDLHLDAEERAKLEQDLSIEIQNGTLSFADKYRILSINNFKYAVNYASILRAKRMKEIQKQKQEDIQAQAQANAQSAQSAEQARQQTEQIIGQIEMQKQEIVNQGLIQKEQVKGQEDRSTLEMKLGGEMQIAQLNGQVAMNKFNELEDRKDERTKLQATQQSKLITQRQRDEDPKDFQNDSIEDSMFELEEND